MRILIAGAEGQVGRELAELAISRSQEAGSTEFEVFALGRQELDITRQEDVQSCIKSLSPDVVVNAAAYTAVDKAEEEKEKAYTVNYIGPRNLAMRCALERTPLIHISTDYVFDGKKSSPYTEDDIPNPLGVYGQSKLAGEKAIQENLERHYILRTSWVFGKYGNNFVKTMRNLAKSRSTIRVVDDQFGSPTSAEQIAEVVLAIVSKSEGRDALPAGIYHFGGGARVSWYQFALEILADLEFDKKFELESILPISSESYPTLAARPKCTCLDNGKLETAISGLRNADWRKELEKLKNAL